MCQVFAGQDPGDYKPVTRRMRLNGQSTSIRLEQRFWSILDGIAATEGTTTPMLVSTLQDEVLELRGETVNFTSLLRTSCLIHLERTLGKDFTLVAE